MTRPVIKDGTRVVLYALSGTNISPSINLKLPYSKNLAEYEASVRRLIFVSQMGIHRLQVQEILGSPSSKLMKSLC